MFAEWVQSYKVGGLEVKGHRARGPVLASERIQAQVPMSNINMLISGRAGVDTFVGTGPEGPTAQSLIFV